MSLAIYPPKRNLILFNGTNFPEEICNSSLVKIHRYLSAIVPDLFTQNYNIEIRANELNYSLRLIGKVCYNIIDTIIKYGSVCLELVYFEVNDKVRHSTTKYVNNNFKCTYNILYDPISFRQPDDTIRTQMIEFIIQFGYFPNICFIGGEITLFGKILNYEKALFYTDFRSIYLDILRNINIDNESRKCKLINYDNCSIYNEVNEFMSDDEYCIILNTGSSGLGKHLATELSKLLAYRLIIISCNKKSFAKDIIILETGGYLVKYKYDIVTNYEINIYILE
jgi:hypothetical protein